MDKYRVGIGGLVAVSPVKGMADGTAMVVPRADDALSVHQFQRAMVDEKSVIHPTCYALSQLLIGSEQYMQVLCGCSTIKLSNVLEPLPCI